MYVMNGEERCEDTLMLVAECACKKHRGEPVEEVGDIVSHFIAQWAGECGACGTGFEPGAYCGFTEDDVMVGPCCADDGS